MSHIRKTIFSAENSDTSGFCTADAGSDKSGADFTGMTLDGTGSTSETGVITDYLWEIIAFGAGMILDTPTASTTTLSGTAVTGTTTIRLTITDSFDNTSTDTVDVVITPPPTLIVEHTLPDSSLEGTLTFSQGQPSEVLDLTYALYSGNNPDSVTFDGGIMNGVLTYAQPATVGSVTLDGNGDFTSNYAGVGTFFQVDITIVGRSSSEPIPTPANEYIQFFS